MTILLFEVLSTILQINYFTNVKNQEIILREFIFFILYSRKQYIN